MKLNSKGFAISSIMYIILVLGVILMVITLALLGSRKLVLDKLKGEAISSIYNEESIEPICFLASDSTKTGTEIGAKYNCQVNEQNNYTFYVLSNNADGTINLIMDQNINSDGTLSGTVGVKQTSDPQKYNFVAWNNELNQGTNLYGPITAMKFLYNATINWTNLNPIEFEYDNEEFKTESLGYQLFRSIDGIATITAADGSSIAIGNNEFPLRARMPIYSAKYVDETEVSNKTADTEFLYSNLSTTLVGYWTMTSGETDKFKSWVVYYGTNTILEANSNYGDAMGVRPVVTIPISKLS